MSKQLIKSTVVVGSMTFVSRILGFVREMLIARIFGADAGTDAFFAVFNVPNLLRRLFAEGAFAQALVPVLSDYKRHGGETALRSFIGRAGGTLAFALVILALVGMLLAPLLTLLFAPGFIGRGEQYDLAVQMLRITMPCVFFIGSVAFAGGILNVCGKFAVPAMTPALLNICMIAAVLWLAPLLQEPVMALAWSVIAGSAVQLLFQFPALLRLGMVPRPRISINDPGVKRTMELMLPAIVGVSVTQINLMLDTLIASFLKTGSVSWLYYSDRLVEFPLGVFGIALATALLPKLANDYAAGDAQGFSRSLDAGLRLTLLIGLPATLGLILIAQPLISTLYEYDAFSINDVTMTARSLTGYALGLLGFMLIKVLAPGFAARQDTRTPMRFGLYALLAHLALSLVFVMPLAHAGLALATSLAAFFNAGLLLALLLKAGIYKPSARWRLFVFRLLFANAVMVAVLIGGVDTEKWTHWEASQRVLQLFLWIGVAMLVYASALLLSGLKICDVAEKDLTG
ncbi:MAG: murein biosynthesis integral membrane protein MurJ [Gammaproteobacteria bacterium]